ncbi:dystrobrevin beta isoform X1 [Diaphorina citri]|uniref:Dystrobrevin n=1 Tax=Diaphorina citri TaxID=121845 RepID=A0A3Q0IU82_DIACI|nr:dystrobrevin beta isoform X1 [Diaphorina citri]
MHNIISYVSVHTIDIWNVIEAFRENGLNAIELQSDVSVARFETLLSSLYHNLNKRLPVSQQVHVEVLSGLLLNWLLSAYSVESLGRIRVFSIKVALATMCSGKLMDKLRYIFSQLCDCNGHLVAWKFNEYLQDVLAIPAAVLESPSFSYTDTLAQEIFSGNGKVTVNDFMDTMMSEPGPACLIWLPLLHRLTAVESTSHPIACDACGRANFVGFRYRCAKCGNFQMCQECFWWGRVSGGHNLEHEVKEYTTYKSPSKQIGHSLRKSFRCVPEKAKANNIPRFPEEPEKTLNLSHIVPPSPLPSHNGFPDMLSNTFDVSSMDSRSTSTARSPGRYNMGTLEASRLDDEHKLIARYAAKLAAENRSVGKAPSEGSLSLDTSRAQRELVSQLESKNREIMREIARLSLYLFLRRQQELEGVCASGFEDNPALMSELRALRMRKDELESHLASLQDSRRHLMVQLEGLMRLLKTHQGTSPNSSPREASDNEDSSNDSNRKPSDKPTEEEEQTWRRNRYEQEAQLAAELKARIQLKNKEQSYAEKGVGSSSGQANVDQATVNKTKEWEDAMKQWVNR